MVDGTNLMFCLLFRQQSLQMSGTGGPDRQVRLLRRQHPEQLRQVQQVPSRMASRPALNPNSRRKRLPHSSSRSQSSSRVSQNRLGQLQLRIRAPLLLVRRWGSAVTAFTPCLPQSAPMLAALQPTLSWRVASTGCCFPERVPLLQASAPAPAIQTAEELGRKAWAPSASLSSDEKARSQVHKHVTSTGFITHALHCSLKLFNIYSFYGGATHTRCKHLGSKIDYSYTARATLWRTADVLMLGLMQAVRAVKGILNKLTPEKFDVLLEQLKSTITNTEILHSSISLVFENAVAQPTFVKMYADLCDRLSKVCCIWVVSAGNGVRG